MGRPFVYGTSRQALSSLLCHRQTLSTMLLLDRQQAAADVGPSLRVWDTTTSVLVASHDGRSISSATFSQDGKSIVTGDGDGNVTVYDVDGSTVTKRTVVAFQQGEIRLAAFVDAGRLISAGTDGTVKIRPLAGATRSLPIKVFVAEHGSPITSAGLSEDRQLFATGSADGAVKLWKTSNAEQVGSFRGAGSVTALAVSSNKQTVLTGDADGIITAWDASSGQAISKVTAHRGAVATVSFSPGNSDFASQSEGGVVSVWVASNSMP